MSKLIRCGDSAPDDTYKMLSCKNCGGKFPYVVKGRPPTVCPWSREQARNSALARQKQRGTREPGATPVPVFMAVDFATLHKGDTVYRVSPLIKDDTLRRKYAYEYVVLGVSGNTVTIRRSQKTGYVHHDIVVNKERSSLLTKSGVEYVVLKQETEVEEENDE